MSGIRRDGIPKVLKWAVFERDNYTCRYCGARGVPMECDHVYPDSKGGPTVIENLVTACEPCNRGKRDRLGIYPLPLDYLEKMNQADAVIKWYNDYQVALQQKVVQRAMLKFQASMDEEFKRIDTAYRRRQWLFTGIRSLPYLGGLLLAIGSIWLFVQVYFINTGRPYPAALFIVPYILMGLSLLAVPVYRRALDWYCRLPYPRYEVDAAEIVSELSAKE